MKWLLAVLFVVSVAGFVLAGGAGCILNPAGSDYVCVSLSADSAQPYPVDSSTHVGLYVNANAQSSTGPLILSCQRPNGLACNLKGVTLNGAPIDFSGGSYTIASTGNSYSGTVSFPTGGLAAGTYSFRVVAPPQAGETEVSNNSAGTIVTLFSSRQPVPDVTPLLALGIGLSVAFFLGRKGSG